MNLLHVQCTHKFKQLFCIEKKHSFKSGFKASRYKNSNENQIQFGEITQYAFGSLKKYQKLRT